MNTTVFGLWDYVVFGLMLVSSISIGVYYAVRVKNQNTSEYLVASHSMTFLPVALSLIATFQSSIMMLGTPAESYVYGISWVLAELGTITGETLEIMLTLVFLRRLNLTTPFEYFERRFQSRGLRVLANMMYTVNYLIYIGVVLYGQGMALQAATGFSMYGSIILTAGTAIIYTSIGGLRAVIWTDVLQVVIMFTGLLVVTIKGTLDAGGIVEVWTRASQSGRLDFRSFMITIPGLSLLPCIALAEGIVAYAYYSFKRCDPLVSHQIDTPNQIIPFMMMDLLKNFPGLPGLFLASLSSATLSTISSCLSSTANIALYDIAKPCRSNMSERRQLLLARCAVVLFGVIGCFMAIILSLAASKTLNQVVYTFDSIGRNIVVGLFYVGALFPFVNAKGAVVGFVTGTVVICWLVFGSMFSAAGQPTPYFPLGSTDQCPDFNLTSTPLNISTLTPSTTNYTQVTLPDNAVTNANYVLDKFYSLSYILFSPLATCVVLLAGTITSLVTGGWRQRADPELVIQMDDVQCLCRPWRRRRYTIANRDQTGSQQPGEEQISMTPTNGNPQELY